MKINKALQLFCYLLTTAIIAACVIGVGWTLTRTMEPPPVVNRVNELTCTKGVPVTYYGFDTAYTIGYCGVSEANTEWAGERQEVVCNAREGKIIAVEGHTMRCGNTEGEG